MLKKLIAVAFALLMTPDLLLAATPVNINTADAGAIAKALDRIGPAKAEAIVAYRDAHGPFRSVDDLGHVKGIGKATIELNRAAILLDGTAPLAAAEGESAAPVKPAHKHKKKAAAAAADTE